MINIRFKDTDITMYHIERAIQKLGEAYAYAAYGCGGFFSIEESIAEKTRGMIPSAVCSASAVLQYIPVSPNASNTLNDDSQIIAYIESLGELINDAVGFIICIISDRMAELSAEGRRVFIEALPLFWFRAIPNGLISDVENAINHFPKESLLFDFCLDIFNAAGVFKERIVDQFSASTYKEKANHPTNTYPSTHIRAALLQLISKVPECKQLDKTRIVRFVETIVTGSTPERPQNTVGYKRPTANAKLGGQEILNLLIPPPQSKSR